jgi:uncharacterized protein (PEP-CTERM system associated)
MATDTDTVMTRRRSVHSATVLTALSGALSLGGSLSATAGDWTITPRINVEQTYSDNVGLRPSGLERDELITSVNPGIAVRGEGKRIQVSFEYNLEGLRYHRDDSANAINQQAQFQGTAELWKDVAFVDTNLTHSQQNTNSLGVTAADNIATTGNSSDVTTLSISPYFRHHLGNLADTESRFTANSVTNDQNGVKSTSTSRTSQLMVNSGRKFARSPWNVTYRTERIENTDGSLTRFRSLNGELRYRIDRHYGLVARLGHERNEFASSVSDQDGRSWSFGGTWTPTPRTNVEAGYGHRFFDHNYFLTAEHTMRRLRFSASYNEDVTTTRQIQLERILVPLVDDVGEPVFDPATGSQAEVPVDTVNATNEVLVQAAFAGSIAYSHRRIDATLSLFATERTFQVSRNVSTVSGARLRVSRRLSRVGTLTFNSSVQITEDSASNQEDTRVSADLRYSHRFGQTFRATAALAHVQQSSSVVTNEYDENRVTLGVVATF